MADWGEKEGKTKIEKFENLENKRSFSDKKKFFSWFLKGCHLVRSEDIEVFVIFPLPFHTFQIQKDKWKWNNL